MCEAPGTGPGAGRNFFHWLNAMPTLISTASILSIPLHLPIHIYPVYTSAHIYSAIYPYPVIHTVSGMILLQQNGDQA